MPPGELKNDPTFGMVTVYHGPIRVRLPLPRPIASSMVLSVTSQGCADLGVCYPPQTRSYRVAADGSVTSVATGNTATAGGGDLAGEGESRFPVWLEFNLHPRMALHRRSCWAFCSPAC
jgi:thiol:disulfide interchange protein DsbD